jgi:anaerobic selenocysteine-containing dehydrogenase
VSDVRLETDEFTEAQLADVEEPAPVRRNSLMRQWDGKLTQELAQGPGGFGLGQIPERNKPDATTTMVCGFCSTGCGLRVHLKDGEAIGLTPKTEYPVNLGMACPKGWEALSVLEADDRATTPLLRGGNGKLQPIGWDQALTTFVERFKTIGEKQGPESVAFLSTGQITSEEMAMLGALTKFGMGVRHGDGNTRQCMATAVTAYKQSFGFDAPPYTYEDFEESDLIVLVGSNLCIAHPIMWERILRNRRSPNIVVIDPRSTETAMAATHHLAIRPKSDLVFFYGLAHLLIKNGWIDEKFIDTHTSEFEAFSAHVVPYTPVHVAEVSGLDESVVCETAQMIHDAERASFWWTMGVNQSYEGTRVAQSLINLSLMTGNIGKPGTGANSITGQCNAMGSRLFSNTSSLMGGHDFTNADHRAKVSGVLGVDVSDIPTDAGMAYDQIIEGIVRGDIRGLWVIGTNSAHSWINQKHLRNVFDRLEFLVVQDMYHSTETAVMADLILPAAGWGEKEGTFINSERRIGVLKKVSKAPGEALDDFSIFKLVAEYWGIGSMFERWNKPEDVFRALAELSQGRPCDFSAITDYQMIDERGGIQWPYRGEADDATQRRLFADGVFPHADGRAKFIFEDPRPMPEQTSKRFPLLLMTGRGTASQWHTQTRTSKSAVLRKLYPAEAYVQINPADARPRGIENEEMVVVESRCDKIKVRARLTRAVRPGQVFIPMHYAQTNRLTVAEFDPYSRQPSYKSTTVQLHNPADL